MHRTNLIIAAGVAAICGVAHAAQPASLLAATNPFAKVSPLQYGYPQFDKIGNDDYAPAFAEGMRQQAAEIDAIANNKKPASSSRVSTISAEALASSSTFCANVVCSLALSLIHI